MTLEQQIEKEFNELFTIVFHHTNNSRPDHELLASHPGSHVQHEYRHRSKHNPQEHMQLRTRYLMYTWKQSQTDQQNLVRNFVHLIESNSLAAGHCDEMLQAIKRSPSLQACFETEDLR